MRRDGPAAVVGHELGEQSSPLGVRQRRHVVAVEVEEVEHDVADRNLLGPPAHFGRTADVHAVLQPAEAGSTLVVERDDLTVEHDGVPGERVGQCCELGVAIGRVDPVARSGA